MYIHQIIHLIIHFLYQIFKKEEDGNISKRAETDLEYGITLTMTTNLPLEYQIVKNGQILNAQQEIITDDDGTYYKRYH